MNGYTKTHKYEDTFSILLPAFDHLVVCIFCSLGVQGEERTGAVGEDGSVSIYFIQDYELEENRLKR